MVNPIEIITSETADVNTVDVMSAQWPVDNVYTYEEPKVEEIFLTWDSRNLYKN